MPRDVSRTAHAGIFGLQVDGKVRVIARSVGGEFADWKGAVVEAGACAVNHVSDVNETANRR
jgi:hypothetical protein